MRRPIHRRDDRFERDITVLSGVPLEIERFEPLLRRPHVIADHGNCIALIVADDVVDTRHAARCRLIHTGEFATLHGCDRDGPETHIGHDDVDAVECSPVDLGRRIDPLGAGADQLELRRILQLDIGGHRQLRGIARDVAIGG